MALCVFSVDRVSSEGNCSYQDVLNHLQLTENKNLFTLARPVKNHTQPTEVDLDMRLYAILDVVSISCDKDGQLHSGHLSCFITEVVAPFEPPRSLRSPKDLQRQG